MPEQWFSEDYKDRRDTCNVPDDVTFHTKPQLAVEMLQAIRSKGRLPFKYLVADCLYGNSPDFLDAVDSCIGVTSLVSIPADTRCWLQRPLTTEKTYTYRGEVRRQTYGGRGDTGPWHGGELGAESRVLVLVSPYGLRRHQRPDRLWVCPQTGDAQQGWTPRPDRVARDQAHPGGRADVLRTTSAMLLRARHCACSCGSVGYGGPSNRALRKRKRNWAWIIMKGANIPAGITIC